VLQVQKVNQLLSWFSSQARLIAGIDEAGRGPLAGPVVASAVVLDPDVTISGLDDSKKLTEKKREELFDEIRGGALSIGIAMVDVDVIDSRNILRASLQAMNQAFLQAEQGYTSLIGALVDGNQKAPLPKRVIQHTVVDGDTIWPSIMAASIIAKVTRDRYMVEQSRRYPKYGFEYHKGYATPAHLQALMQYGPCPLHRKSFGPVSQLSLGL
jgi:ribonuclease HII